MGAAHIVQGWFTLDKDITVQEDGSLDRRAGRRPEALTQIVDQFSAALGTGGRCSPAAGCDRDHRPPPPM